MAGALSFRVGGFEPVHVVAEAPGGLVLLAARPRPSGAPSTASPQQHQRRQYAHVVAITQDTVPRVRATRERSEAVLRAAFQDRRPPVFAERVLAWQLQPPHLLFAVPDALRIDIFSALVEAEPPAFT